MSTKSIITRELNESIRNVLARNVKISFKSLVLMETKPEKTEKRILAFSACRLFILTAKVPTKIEQTFHYLDIQCIDSKKFTQLSLTIEGRAFTFHTPDPDSEDVNHMIIQLGTAIKSIFPQVPLEHIIRKFEVMPPSRLQAMTEYNMQLENKDNGPCGGYSTQYACMCDYHGLPYREEVAWDVDTIYLSHDSKELSLLDFDHLEGRDIVPIISALAYNAWFTKFRASNTRLVIEALDQILYVMKRSLSIEELYLDNIGVKWDFAHKLSMTLIANNNTALHTLDLSNNMIEDKGINSLSGIIAKITQGVGHLSGPVGKLQKGLIHLNLSRTSLTAKGVNALSHALSLNRAMPSTLNYLNLSENIFKEDVTNLYNFLAQPNALTHLDLSGTECALDTVFGALLRGCTQKLAYLNLSKNQFTTKKSKEVIVPPSFKQFFSSTVALKYLNMSHNKLPIDALKAMLLGLACNEIATEVSLDLSYSDLRAQGALVLESCLPGIRCLSSLDITENGFDVDLASIINSVAKNKSLKHLYIGKNFTNIKAKHMNRVVDSLVQLVQDEEAVLENLSLADSKLRQDTCLIINALGSNQSLISIDITGNYMGAAGAKTLAKALQINTKLRTIKWDRNATPPQGFLDIAYSLEKNFTLRYMPWPIHDATAAMKIGPDRTEAAFRKIDHYLHRNVSPKKYTNTQAFRLQQGFLLGSTQQMVDRLMIRLQDAVANANKAEGVNCQEEILTAEGYLADANNAKQLLVRLHEVVLQQEESGNPVELKLQDFASELKISMDSHLMATASCLLKCVEDQCPNVIGDDHVRREIEKVCQEKGSMPPEFVNQAILDQAGTDIVNKVSEVNLSMAAHVSDRVLDEVIESLSRSYKDLMEKLNQQRSTTPDVLRSRAPGDSLRMSQSGDSQLDSLSGNSESPLATPKLPNKRKSVHSRKLRPHSVVDNIDGLPVDDIPDLLPKGSDEILPSLSPVCDPLNHLGKARPKRRKTRAPTKNALQSKINQENLEEGLDQFFNRPATSSPDLEESSSARIPIRKLNKDAEKRGFMKGFSNLFNRVTESSSHHLHKSKSFESSSVEPSPTHSTGCSPSSDDKKKENGEEISIDVGRVRPPLGLANTNSDLLAEMKARQEKRSTITAASLGKTQGEDKSLLDNSLFPSVKLKPTGLGSTLRSATLDESTSRPSSIASISPSSSPLLSNTKPRPPPIAPKPRPKSLGGSELRLSGEYLGTTQDDSPLELAETPELPSSSKDPPVRNPPKKSFSSSNVLSNGSSTQESSVVKQPAVSSSSRSSYSEEVDYSSPSAPISSLNKDS